MVKIEWKHLIAYSSGATDSASLLKVEVAGSSLDCDII